MHATRHSSCPTHVFHIRKRLSLRLIKTRDTLPHTERIPKVFLQSKHFQGNIRNYFQINTDSGSAWAVFNLCHPLLLAIPGARRHSFNSMLLLNMPGFYRQVELSLVDTWPGWLQLSIWWQQMTCTQWVFLNGCDILTDKTERWGQRGVRCVFDP